jgi:hypothetical protein
LQIFAPIHNLSKTTTEHQICISGLLNNRYLHICKKTAENNIKGFGHNKKLKLFFTDIQLQNKKKWELMMMWLNLNSVLFDMVWKDSTDFTQFSSLSCTCREHGTADVTFWPSSHSFSQTLIVLLTSWGTLRMIWQSASYRHNYW